MYYVYEWYNVDTYEVIYVGKGTGLRYKVRKHNKLFNEMIKRFPCESRIVKEFENEKEAFEYEYEYIKEKKAKGQCVCNIYDGGMGGTTSWWTDELREKYSQNNVMKSEKQRKRMKVQNPMKDKAVAMKNGCSHWRSVIIGDNGYASVKATMIAYNTSFETIQNWCRKGINPYGEKCRYEDEEQVEFVGKRFNKGGCRPLTYKGKHYEAVIDLANEMGLTSTVALRWLKFGFDPYGNPCRYDDDTRELTFTIKKKAHHPVIVNGVHYKTFAEAGRANGISAQMVADLTNHKYSNPKYICEYDNQQPIQGNTDKSTLKGSETNG